MFQYINVFATLGLFVSWAFPFAFQRIMLWCFSLSYILEFLINERFREFKWSNDKWLYVVYLAFFALVPAYQWIIGGSFSESIFIKTLEQVMPFMAFFLVGLGSYNKRLRLRYVAYAMVGISCLMVCYLIFYRIGLADFWAADDKREMLNSTRIKYWTHHMNANLFFNISLLLAFFVLLREQIRPWIKILVAVASLPIVYALIMTEGRVGFATFMLLMVVFAVVLVWKWKRRLLWIFLPVLFLVYSVALFSFARINTSFSDPRVDLWSVAWRLIKARPLGYGPVDGRKLFVDDVFEGYPDALKFPLTFFTDQYPDPAQRYVLHPHNEYLNLLLKFGIVGLALFLLIFVLALYAAKPGQRIFVACFLMIVGTQYCFDVFDVVQPLVLAMGLTLWLRAPALWSRSELRV